MRKPKFRGFYPTLTGKAVITLNGEEIRGEWLTGSHICDAQQGEYITKVGEYCEKVIPETVGEFTGVCDKTSERIFEGDVVQARIEGGPYDAFKFPIGSIVFDGGAFCLRDKKSTTPLRNFSPRVTLEIVDNIYENPELLTGEG